MKRYTQLAVSDPDAFLFGHCPHPLTTPSGLVIGGGTVYPELNFTLPAMAITRDTMPEVRAQYVQMIRSACERAVRLGVPGLVVEFELLPELTREPSRGAAVTAILRETLDRFAASDGLKSALRVTPNDVREFERPPRMREGPLWDTMMESFAACSREGATLLSIESTGGKEIHDDALLAGDLATATFALAILGSRDMAFLWSAIVDIAQAHGVIPAGDTACGFANTAMTLAEGRFIPQVWAAVNRVMTVARSLVAYECGAVGPSKDCAYEGPYLKAITGYPVALEGAEAACAHSSPIGNITRAVADLWSNESVQNVKLLGGMAPTVSLEQLAYATRLMNTASSAGPDEARRLRDLFVASDAGSDPQAYVLRPDVVLHLAAQIVAEPTPYLRTRRAARSTLAVLRKAHADGALALIPRERAWIDRLSRQADALPDDEETFVARMLDSLDTSKVRPDQYGFGVSSFEFRVSS